ncbi:hypothetical protein HDU67_002504 [Dinochytrium kinnereticum]|nr:hypothetical protein HDU67_002504 [Dinochytrium kinnereticum]
MTIATGDSLRFLVDTKAPLARLEAKKHFESLTDKEKLYAHHIVKASWAGFSVIAAQLSHESLTLVKLFTEVFKEPGSNPPRTRDLNALKKASGVTDEAWTFFLEFAVQVLYITDPTPSHAKDASNFKSFGDTKFIPRGQEADFEKIVGASGSSFASSSFETLKNHIFALQPAASLLIGYPDDGHVSGYYSTDITQDDIAFHNLMVLLQTYLESKNISALNTRLFKTSTGYIVRVASSIVKTEDHIHQDKTITVAYGDFQEAMKIAAEHMRSAVSFAANENQKVMLEKYAESFETGSMEAHKESQKAWIKDVGPTVETNIGFVETYKDPAGVRAEWEGFVAVVNKEMTAKFERLVNGASDFIRRLPWGPEFEKDKFNRPDFTSLEVVAFSTSGHPPAGINIPNYDDIRMSFGFKNVSLGNVVNAPVPGETLTFIAPEDEDLYRKFRGEAFEVQVGLHELLGHGSGKLLSEEPAGVYNFNVADPPMNPVTGKKVDTWYKPGETWGSKFGPIASSYEECRAETVAMALVIDREILSIFTEDQHADDVIFIAYLQMARMGFTALEFYDPSSKKWGQAHMQARFAIFNELLRCGVASISISADGDDAIIRVDRTKILSHGAPAMNEFLMKLHVYKATGDAENGIRWYRDVTSVPDEWSSHRDIVLKKKLARKVFVQGNTFLVDGRVSFKDYPTTLEGFIDSFVERDIPL